MARGRKYEEAASKVDVEKDYSPSEALNLVKEIAYTKFDGTVEVHMRMGVDPRHAEQQIREVVMLPHGLGKTVSVLVFAQGEAARAAKEAGADMVADDEATLKKVGEGPLDYDVAIATTDMMGEVGKLGRVLGPRGLMPNPKAGTVVDPDQITRAVDEAKAGRVEFRIDKTANLHIPIGKVSFGEQQLLENFTAVMEAVRKARPAAAKGAYIRRLVVCSTMGPSVGVDPSAALELETAD
jgi:large subunit ribosomal protein L1